MGGGGPDDESPKPVAGTARDTYEGKWRSMTDAICEVIITADNAEWLINFTRHLIEDRLAACGQHLGGIQSIYRWDGDIQQDTETRVALHTRESLVPAILERVKEQHPYQVPCVLALPVQHGNPDYIGWVLAETESPTEAS
jgi:periplasmic divalent cation tolerance protein